MCIRVVSADSHPVTALGIKAILSKCEGICFVSAVSEEKSLLDFASEHECDVVVTDQGSVSSEQGSASKTLIALVLSKHPEVGVVLHSCVRNAAYIATLCQLGVHALLDKNDVIEHLESAIVAAHMKASYVSPSLAAPKATLPRDREGMRALSACEIKVLKAVLSGLTVKEISKKVHRSKQTISTHKKNAMQKLRVSSEAELFRTFSEEHFDLVNLGGSVVEKG